MINWSIEGKLTLYMHKYIYAQVVAELVEATCYTSEGLGPIPEDAILHRHDAFDRKMILVSTQHLKEISARNISWG
jgi:hypothetical protein